MEQAGQSVGTMGAQVGATTGMGGGIPEGMVEILLFGVMSSVIFLFATYVGVKIGTYFVSQSMRKKKFLKTIKIEEEEKGNSVQVLSFDKNGNPKLLLIEEKEGNKKEYRYL